MLEGSKSSTAPDLTHQPPLARRRHSPQAHPADICQETKHRAIPSHLNDEEDSAPPDLLEPTTTRPRMKIWHVEHVRCLSKQNRPASLPDQAHRLSESPAHQLKPRTKAKPNLPIIHIHKPHKLDHSPRPIRTPTSTFSPYQSHLTLPDQWTLGVRYDLPMYLDGLRTLLIERLSTNRPEPFCTKLPTSSDIKEPMRRGIEGCLRRF